MKERPILFNDAMVRAILDGRKTQTRRIFRPQPETGNSFSDAAEITPAFRSPPHGCVGDRLWVREAHAFVPATAYRCSQGIYQQIDPDDSHQACIYRQGFDRARSFPWRPSIHMPRWASRITLEITGVRVERLQDITEEDAIAEGPPGLAFPAPPGSFWVTDDGRRNAFRFLWESINGDGSWAANPWVWVIEFKRLEAA